MSCTNRWSNIFISGRETRRTRSNKSWLYCRRYEACLKKVVQFHEISVTKIMNKWLNDFIIIVTAKTSWNQNLKNVCFFSTAWLQHDQFNIESALEKTIGTMQCVLNRTLNYAKTVGGEHPSPQQLELKLIQSRDDLLNPQVKIKATKI